MIDPLGLDTQTGVALRLTTYGSNHRGLWCSGIEKVDIRKSSARLTLRYESLQHLPTLNL